MTDQIIVSNSSIQTFKQCRRKFWLESYRRLRPKKEDYVGPLPLGSRIHLALELYYKSIGEGMTVEEANLPAIWSSLCEEERATLIDGFEDTTAFDKEAELGRIMLEGYLEWLEEEGIDSDVDITSQEERLDADFLDGRVKLVGKIDQRIRRKADGTRMIRDFKTTANFADIEKTIAQNEQFITYMLLEMLKKDEGDRVSGAVVTALKKNKRGATSKPPYYKQFEVEHNVFELRNFYKRLLGELQEIVDMWDKLDAGWDHHMVAYPTPTRDCSWKCPFYVGCQMFDDGSDVERWLSDNFNEGDPFEYYGDLSPNAEG